MWLLLAAAGTGYLARCWQKARKSKSRSSVFKQNAALYMSQKSPSCTPRRGRSTNASRRGSRKRSQSAKCRKVLPGRREGRLVRNHTKDCDENLGSFEKHFEELLGSNDDLSGQCGLKDQNTPGQVQTGSQVNNLPGNNKTEHYLSLSSMCVQDQCRETSSCMKQPLLLTAEVDNEEPLLCMCALSNNKPIFESLHGCSAATVNLVKNQLSIVAASSRSRLDSSKPMENSLVASDVKRNATPSCLQIPRIKTTRESRTLNCAYKSIGSPEQVFSFFTNMARELGQKTYSTFTSKFLNRVGRRSCTKAGLSQNPRKEPVCHSLSYGNLWAEIPEKEKGLSLQRDKHVSNSCALHSRLLKALLDPEDLDQCHRCNYLTVSVTDNDTENAVPCLIHHAGLSMAMDKKIIVNSGGESKKNHWKHSKGQATGFPKPINRSMNHSLGFDESSLVALGVAMGVAFVARGHRNEFEDLHKLLEKTNSSIEELRKQLDSRFEFDFMKLIKIEKFDESVHSKPAMPYETCPWKAHQDSETNSGKSGAEISSFERFSADNNDGPNTLSENHICGLNELEAELEAELQLMERNICNTNLVDYEWKQTQSNQNWQPEGDDGLYVDMDIRDSMAVQDAEQLYESDFVVPPLELERRLWQVLEQRHEERICELENDLHIINEKVTAKELEVQWWKDRVWWLMETSLGGKNDNKQS